MTARPHAKWKTLWFVPPNVNIIGRSTFILQNNKKKIAEKHTSIKEYPIENSKYHNCHNNMILLYMLPDHIIFHILNTQNTPHNNYSC